MACRRTLPVCAEAANSSRRGPRRHRRRTRCIACDTRVRSDGCNRCVRSDGCGLARRGVRRRRARRREIDDRRVHGRFLVRYRRRPWRAQKESHRQRCQNSEAEKHRDDGPPRLAGSGSCSISSETPATAGRPRMLKTRPVTGGCDEAVDWLVGLRHEIDGLVDAQNEVGVGIGCDGCNRCGGCNRCDGCDGCNGCDRTGTFAPDRTYCTHCTHCTCTRQRRGEITRKLRAHRWIGRQRQLEGAAQTCRAPLRAPSGCPQIRACRSRLERDRAE